MKAVVLESKQILTLRDFPIEETLGPRDVRVAIRVVGICGSDVHYYQHGAIGPFVVREPMILGHEAAGEVIETGADVAHLKAGDRVCMEPGYPENPGRASHEGMYNLDPSIRFWATPPVHGCLRPEVVHPADFTYKLPDTVSFEEGAMVEPLAVGMHAAAKARIRPGDVALVTGAGPIGLLTALAAQAAGCSHVFITDVVPEKLELAAKLGSVTPIDVRKEPVRERILEATGGWGVDCVFESSGNSVVFPDILASVAPGGCLVLVGMPQEPVPFDIVAAQVKEVRVEHVFRYAHVFQRAVALMGSGQLDVKPLITDTFAFEDSVAAFDFASAMPPASVKAQIQL
ncbi:MAG: NAD(P)-dependent alcohol dehydrogenase [Puniceicoccaceae bacterium]